MADDDSNSPPAWMATVLAQIETISTKIGAVQEGFTELQQQFKKFKRGSSARPGAVRELPPFMTQHIIKDLDECDAGEPDWGCLCDAAGEKLVASYITLPRNCRAKVIADDQRLAFKLRAEVNTHADDLLVRWYQSDVHRKFETHYKGPVQEGDQPEHIDSRLSEYTARIQRWLTEKGCNVPATWIVSKIEGRISGRKRVFNRKLKDARKGQASSSPQVKVERDKGIPSPLKKPDNVPFGRVKGTKPKTGLAPIFDKISNESSGDDREEDQDLEGDNSDDSDHSAKVAALAKAFDESQTSKDKMQVY
jgi:hypothetical protein